MKRNRAFLLAVATAAFMVAAHLAQAACKPPSFTAAERKAVPTRNIDQTLLSKAIAKQTNYYRCKSGLKPLAHDPRLTSAAQMHSRNMAKLKTLNHELPVYGKRTVGDRYKAARVRVERVRAENIGTDFRLVFGNRVFLTKNASACRFVYQDTREPVPVHSYGSLAQSVVRHWWKSSKHRKNMLHGKIKRIGAAAEFTVDKQAPCGTYYFTQNFAG